MVGCRCGADKRSHGSDTASSVMCFRTSDRAQVARSIATVRLNSPSNINLSQPKGVCRLASGLDQGCHRFDYFVACQGHSCTLIDAGAKGASAVGRRRSRGDGPAMVAFRKPPSHCRPRPRRNRWTDDRGTPLVAPVSDHSAAGSVRLTPAIAQQKGEWVVAGRGIFVRRD
jgi:hypothetical protein